MGRNSRKTISSVRPYYLTPNAKHNSFKSKSSDDSYYSLDDEPALEFQSQLNKIGLDFRAIPSDGNCLFSAISDQLYGTFSHHRKIREQVVCYIENHREEFEGFFDVGFQLKSLRMMGTYGGHESIIAVARVYSVCVVVYQLNQQPWLAGTPNQHQTDFKTENYPQLHLAYHNGEHYSSIRVFGDATTKPSRIKICLQRRLNVETLQLEGSTPNSCRFEETMSCSSYRSLETDDSRDDSCEYSYFAPINDGIQSYKINQKKTKREKHILKWKCKKTTGTSSECDFVVNCLSALHI